MDIKTDCDRFIEEIQSNFVTSQIMTRIDEFVYYEDIKDKKENNYDILPLKKLKKYWNKNTNKVYSVIPEDIISSKLDLLSLLECFKDKDFYFVKYGRDIEGLVHYSDLKKTPVRVLFYILITNLEIELRGIYDTKETIIKMNIGKKRLKEIKKRMNEDKSKNQDLNIFEYLYLADLLNIIAKDNETLKKLGIRSKSQFEKFNSLNHLRNWVAHPVCKEFKGGNIKLFLLEQKQKLCRLNEYLNNYYVD